MTSAAKKKAKVMADEAARSSAVTDSVQRLPVGKILPSPKNRRILDNDPTIISLANCIKSQGLLQPIVVRPVGTGYEIVCGERRWRAVRLLGLDEIEATIRPMDDKQAAVARVVENMQRVDVPPLEQAEAVQVLMDEHKGKAKEVAKRLGVSESWVRLRAKLANLAPVWRTELSDPQTEYPAIAGQIGIQEMIACLPVRVQETLFTNRAFKYCGTSSADIRKKIESETRVISSAPWADASGDNDAELCLYIGREMEPGTHSTVTACARCDRRTDREPSLWSHLLELQDTDDDARCLDSACWKHKRSWMVHSRVAEALAKNPGAVVLLAKHAAHGESMLLPEDACAFYPYCWKTDEKYQEAIADQSIDEGTMEAVTGIVVDSESMDESFPVIKAWVDKNYLHDDQEEDDQQEEISEEEQERLNLEWKQNRELLAMARQRLEGLIEAQWPCPALRSDAPWEEAIVAACKISLALRMGKVPGETCDVIAEMMQDIKTESSHLHGYTIETLEQLAECMGYDKAELTRS